MVDKAKNDLILEIDNLNKVYPGTVALQGVSFSILKGEVHGIIGKNGAGKSTLVGIIAGIVSPTEGRVIIKGKKYSSLTRITSKQAKIAIVPQEPQVILDMSVAENLFIPNYHVLPGGKVINWNELYVRAEKVISEAGLDLDVKSKAGDLSMSEQQLLLVIKSCYVEDSDIIILDEASASLSQKDEKILYRIINERKQKGKTVIFISHRTEELLQVCDRLTVLRDGKSITTVSCCDLDQEKLSTLIVGEEFRFKKREEKFDSSSHLTEETVLQVLGLTRAGSFRDISFELKKGEILGIAGLRGSGRTEIFRSIIGVDPVDQGSIIYKGLKSRFSSPSHALKKGLVYLPEDREKEGLINNLSVRENLVLTSLKKLTKGILVRRNTEKTFAQKLIDSLDVIASSMEQEVNQLSGGNKQKVVVGRIAASEPEVYILDEPTRGVDIAAKQGILKIIQENLSQEAGILITSPGIDDLMLICHRVLVLYKGQIIGQFSKDNFSESQLFYMIQGGENIIGSCQENEKAITAKL